MGTPPPLRRQGLLSDDPMCIQIEGRYHPSAAEAFPAAAGVADVNSHITPGPGVGGDQQWQATQPMEPPKGEVFRKVPWQGEMQVWYSWYAL